MKIAVRGGHNFQATGACGIIDETREDRKVKDAVIKYLRQAGHSVLDVTPGNCGVMTDLIYGVEKAEEFGAELFISCHFDKCYDNYNGALGHACWTYSNNGTAADIGRRVVNKVSSGTGLKNRGLKTNPNLYELRKTSMPAVIVEVCFCEATEDVRIYREKGADLIGKLIAEGISNKSINAPVVNNEGHNSSEKWGTVTASVLNVRSGAGTNYKIIGQLKRGDRIRLDCKVGEWWSTYYGVHGGFLSKKYISICNK